jgi:hypothetical protein
VNCAAVGVLEQAHQVGLRCLAEGLFGISADPEIQVHIPDDLLDDPHKWEVVEKRFGASLFLADLIEGTWFLLIRTRRIRRFPPTWRFLGVWCAWRFY